MMKEILYPKSSFNFIFSFFNLLFFFSYFLFSINMITHEIFYISSILILSWLLLRTFEILKNIFNKFFSIYNNYDSNILTFNLSVLIPLFIIIGLGYLKIKLSLNFFFNNWINRYNFLFFYKL